MLGIAIVALMGFLFFWQGFSDAELALAEMDRQRHPSSPWRTQWRRWLATATRHWPGYGPAVRHELTQLGREPAQYAMQAILAGGLLALVFGMDFSVVLAPLGLLIGVGGVRWLLHQQYQGWLTQVTAQMGDVVILLKARLQAGETVRQAMRGVTPQVPNPTRVEWTRMIDRLNAGLPLSEVLGRLMDRVPDRDVAAVLQQLAVYDRESVPPDPFGSLSGHLSRMKLLKRDYLVRRSTQSITAYTGLAFFLAMISVLAPVLYGMWTTTLGTGGFL